jgi:hypothetical protein
VGSSLEQVEIAEAIALYLDKIGEVFFWQNISRAGTPFIYSVSEMSSICDFAVFIFNPDDKLNSRGGEFQSIRDNVLFEFGLFIGRIGYERTFAITDQHTNPKIMSDYQGVTLIKYDGSASDIKNSAHNVYLQLKYIINRLGTFEQNKSVEIKEDSKYKVVGIDRIFETYEDAEPEILDDLKNSPGPIRLFLQIASQNIGVKGSLYDIVNILSSKQKEIRILHTDEHSPMFAKDRLLALGKNPETIITSIRHVYESLAKLEEKEGSSVRQRIHHLSFIWRIYAFDNRLYLMPYFSEKDATKKSPVIRFIKREKSMYNTYIEWFDNQWERSAPPTIKLNSLITPATPSGTALFLKWNEFHVFGIPKRYLLASNELKFYGIGGKKNESDGTWEDCALREGAEETSSAIGKLVSSTHTDLFRANSIIKPITIIESEITPRLILEKRKHSGLGAMSKTDDHYYMVGYDATLIKKPIPSRELGAILFLKDHHLKHIRDRIQVTLSDILEMGAEISIQDGCQVDVHKSLLPHGLAIYLLRKL